MQQEQQKLAEMIQGKKVAFIGAGVSHKTLIREFVELGAQVTLCDKKQRLEDFGAYADTLRQLGVALSLGIGLQNLPEGAAVSLPLHQAGHSRPKAFMAGFGSGLVEPLGGVLAALLAVWVRQLMPWLLAGAAGVMIGVTAQDLMPEAASRRPGMVAFLSGFALMMALDVAL